MIKQYLTYEQVAERVALARSTLTRMVRLGQFPRPVKIGAHHVRFIADEIAEWQVARESLRTGGGL